MKAYPIALGVGALATYLLFERGSNPPSQALEWLGLVVSCGSGGLVGGGFVLAWRTLRRTPRATFVVLGILSIPSGVLLWWWHQDRVDVDQFLATADSARGRINGKVPRSGVVFYVGYRVSGQEYAVRDWASKADWTRRVGDSIWVYYPPGLPSQARVSRPEVDKGWWTFLLEATWVLGVSVLLGYGATFVHWMRNADNTLRAT